MPIQLGEAVAVGPAGDGGAASRSPSRSTRITFVPVDGKYAAELELRVAAVDARGNRAPVPVHPLTLTAEPAAPGREATCAYETRSSCGSCRIT